jgi:anthranilate synthase component 2
MIIVIDNYDSFTYNLVHYLGELGAQPEVHRNDKITVDEVLARKPEAIVLSPGPATPDKAGICIELVKQAAGKVPLLGVCLGHQAIGETFGGKVIRAPYQMHGKLSTVHHDGSGVFSGLDQDFEATRYHSLILEKDTLPDALNVTARTDDGIVMGVSHKAHAIHGVQFHPESIASSNGHKLLKNFLDLAAAP